MPEPVRARRPLVRRYVQFAANYPLPKRGHAVDDLN